MKYSNYQFTETAIQSYLAILSKFRFPTPFPTQPTGRGKNKIPYVQCNSKVAIRELWRIWRITCSHSLFVLGILFPKAIHSGNRPFRPKKGLSSLLLPLPLDPFIYPLILNQLIVISIIVTKLFFHFCNGRVNILLCNTRNILK